MGAKPATIAPAAKTKGDPKEVQVARIASSATIQVTRTQVICTIVAALLALLGVVIANLDKFSYSNSTETANKLLIDNKAERVQDFIERNNQDAQGALDALLTKENIPTQYKEITKTVLYTYKAKNLESKEQFIKEKTRLNQAIQTNNTAAIEASRQRLNQIAVEDAENFQDAISTLNHKVLFQLPLKTELPLKTDSNKETDKPSLEPQLEKLTNRKPVRELASLLINRETDPASDEKPRTALNGGFTKPPYSPHAPLTSLSAAINGYINRSTINEGNVLTTGIIFSFSSKSKSVGESSDVNALSESSDVNAPLTFKNSYSVQPSTINERNDFIESNRVGLIYSTKGNGVGLNTFDSDPESADKNAPLTDTNVYSINPSITNEFAAPILKSTPSDKSAPDTKPRQLQFQMRFTF